MSKSPITERIDALLKSKGISKAKFYSDCEITSAAYSLWNQEKTVPSMKNISKIAEYLGAPISYILDGQQKEKPTVKDDGRNPEDIKLRLSRMSVEELRALMGDIAAEMAGRVKE